MRDPSHTRHSSAHAASVALLGRQGFEMDTVPCDFYALRDGTLHCLNMLCEVHWVEKESSNWNRSPERGGTISYIMLGDI